MRPIFFRARGCAQHFKVAPPLISTGRCCLALAIVQQVKPAYKSERRGPHHDRGGSCGTATSFTRATIECALLDLANVNIIGRLECSSKVRRPQGSNAFF